MGKLIDLTGQRFGFWMVLSQDSKNRSGQTQWLCRCECGIQKPVTSNSLRTGNSTSCGCNHSPDFINKKFENLLVMKADYSKGRRNWLCQCDCNNTIIVATYELRKKIKTSCGCKLNKELPKIKDAPLSQPSFIVVLQPVVVKLYTEVNNY